MIVDLTMPIHEGMTTYPRPWHPYVEVSQLGRLGIEGRETRKLVMGTHTGTHVDAPRHFINGGLTVDMIPLDQMNGRACVADLTEMEWPNIDKDDIITAIGDGNPERVLLRFDWDAYLGRMKYYERHPYLTGDAAQWLIENGCRVLGMDTPMPDSPTDETMRNHKSLLGSGVVLVEYLVNLKYLPSDRPFLLTVAPLKILGGDGAPARVFATI